MRNTSSLACGRLFMLRFQYMSIEDHIIKWDIINYNFRVMSKSKTKYVEQH